MPKDQLGLSQKAVDKLKEVYGENTFSDQKKISDLQRLLNQFKSPIIYVLLVISAITLLLKEYSDTVIILLVTVFNAFMGFYQARRAEKTIDSLKKLIILQAKVIRDGSVTIVDSKELVPGDIVILEAGDKIPADGIFIEGRNIFIVESQFNGESFPVEKKLGPEETINRYEALNPKNPEEIDTFIAFISDLKKTSENNKSITGYMTTGMNNGKAKMIVTSTGMNTEIGKITDSVKESNLQQTPLQKKFQKLTKLIISIVLSVTFLIIVLGLIKNIPLIEIFKTSISLGVSAIPEGLPIVLTVTLAIGGWKMAKEKAVLKDLSSTSSLAGVSTIFTDKTGTITVGQITLEEIFTSEYFTSGKNPKTEKDNVLLLSALCNDANINSKMEESGDLLDLALLRKAMKYELDYVDFQLHHPRLQEIPFDSEYKYMATLNEFEDSAKIIMKGAPEVVIEHCKFGDNKIKNEIIKKIEELNRTGFRTILLASKNLKTENLEDSDLKGMDFEALLAFVDPLREDVKDAVKACIRSGINVVMITGDHLETAKYIAKQAGIFSSEDLALTGEEVEAMNTNELQEVIHKLKVVARATPKNKLSLIQAYQSNNEQVAMTGDGVNDAPALSKAEIGISMGKNGTDVARDASDMVLMDDNFSTIVKGIEEARVVFDNLKKVISFLFSTSAGEVLTILAAIIIDLPLPLIAVQILWLNLVTDGFLDIALATEKKEQGVMHYKPARYSGGLLDRLLLTRIGILGGLMAVGSLIIFIMHLQSDGIEYARTVTLATLCIYQWFNVMNMRSEKSSIFKLGVFSNRYINIALVVVISLLLIAIYVPGFSSLMQLTPLRGESWILAILVCIPIILVEEGRKLISRSK